MNINRLHVNITNFGLIGSRYSDTSTFSHAPSAQWPAGTGDEYLYAAGLWVGAKRAGIIGVTTGQPEAELRPSSEIWDTIYEAVNGEIVRPHPGIFGGGVRRFSPGEDDDRDGSVDEDPLDGRDNDGDGYIDEDFGQIGQQMMVCRMRDDDLLGQELYPDHLPLHIEVKQTVNGSSLPGTEDFLGLEYQIRNVGAVPLEDVYIGFYVDSDIGPRETYDGGSDDIAGSFEGIVKGSDNRYRRVNMAYMRDGAVQDPLPGWFGVALMGHTIDWIDYTTPTRVANLSYHHFSSEEPFSRGGDPTTDQERYEALSDGRRDTDTRPEEARDLRFLISSGPFEILEPGQTLTYQLALVVGHGLEGLLATCTEAAQAYAGQWFDADNRQSTGSFCREYKVCAEEFSNIWNSSRNPLYRRWSYFWDPRCRPRYFLVPPDITPESLFVDEDGRHCIYVNADICEECIRYSGRSCDNPAGGSPRSGATAADLRGDAEKAADPCTGYGGRETNLEWATVASPPPPPHMRVWARDAAVHVYWDDRSEHEPDPETGLFDFEAYWIWVSDAWSRPPGSSVETGPDIETWRLTAQYDLVNQFRVSAPGQPPYMLDFGRNTGLDTVAYRPACLDDPRFIRIAEPMRNFVLADWSGEYDVFPPVLDGNGEPRPGLEPFAPWAMYPDVLDTFFLVTERLADETEQIVPKRATRFYEHIERGLKNGFLYFFSVTASDHIVDVTPEGEVITGEGYVGRPYTSFHDATPGFDALAADAWADDDATEKVFVYPNPATRASMAEFQELHPNEDDPTGLRIAFANLPASRCAIKIFTLAGDLVAVLHHDGREGYGQATWNLVSRNGQQVASGIYLFSVEPEDTRFEKFVGKFVIRW